MLYRLRGASLLVLFSLLISLLAARPVRGQDAAQATLTAPELQDFPLVRLNLDARGPQGRFLHGLQAAEVQVLENGAPAPVESLSEMRPGAQVVIALNPGPSFAVRNSKGISRLEYVVEALAAWASHRQGTSIDDLSLTAPNGLEITHLSDMASWVTALQGLEINARELAPNLEPLGRAIELAGGDTPREGMGRAVIFVSPPLENEAVLAAETLARRAVELDVQVTVWMIVPTGAPETEGGRRLTQLAAETGGQFFAISEAEQIPDPETFIEPLRSYYRLEYTSQIRAAGQHQLGVEIAHGDLRISSTPLVFDINLAAPQPVFVSPPLEVQREPLSEKASAEELETGEIRYAPEAQPLEVLVSFPDGNPRPLAATRLYVDGQLVAENTSPPFDQFSWPLEDYASDGEHLLRVEAVDRLGMTGSSIDTAVSVQVTQPEVSPWTSLQPHLPVLAALAVLVTAALVLLVLVWRGRIHPYSRLLRARPRRSEEAPPEPEPVKAQGGKRRRLTSWMARFQWSQHHNAPQVLAYLTPLEKSGVSVKIPTIPLSAEEVSIGSDPDQVMLLLDEPSVEALHARLLHSQEGGFRLCDDGSVAGTWLNFVQVPSEGADLCHGDIVHFGRVGFRFTLRTPQAERAPLVIPLAEKEGAA